MKNNRPIHRKCSARSVMIGGLIQTCRLNRRPNTGFTLTELMVTISIILIVVTAAAITGIKTLSSGAIQHTKIILAAAKSVADEYEIHTGQSINHTSYTNPPTTSPFNWTSRATHTPANDPGPGDNSNDTSLQGNREGPPTTPVANFQRASIERFVWVTYQLPATRAMLTKLGKDVLTDENRNSYLEIRDGWGNKIIYVESVNYNNDPSRLVRYLPQHPRPYFASAGPDGIWATNTNNPNDPAAADNLYSFNID